MSCPYCGTGNHAPTACPRIAAIDYNYNGTIKRVEFVQVQSTTPTPDYERIERLLRP